MILFLMLMFFVFIFGLQIVNLLDYLLKISERKRENEHFKKLEKANSDLKNKYLSLRLKKAFQEEIIKLDKEIKNHDELNKNAL